MRLFPPSAPPIAGAKHLEESLLVGVALIFLGTSVTVPMDVLVKYFTDVYEVFLLLWARFFFHFLFTAAISLVFYGNRLFSLPNLPLQLVRGICLASASLMFFYAIKYLPLADAIALVFVFPLIVTALAPFLLGENVGMHRWGAVVAGFVGACFIIRPGFAGFTWHSLLPVCTGLCFALYLVLNRKLSNCAPTFISLAMMSAPGALVFSMALPAFWEMPQIRHLWLFPVIGMLGAGGHFFYIRAYTKAPAVVLAPFGYLELPIAVFFGWIVFRDFPDRITWTGIAILVVSGLYILHRERLLAKRAAAVATLP